MPPFVPDPPIASGRERGAGASGEADLEPADGSPREPRPGDARRRMVVAVAVVIALLGIGQVSAVVTEGWGHLLVGVGLLLLVLGLIRSPWPDAEVRAADQPSSRPDRAQLRLDGPRWSSVQSASWSRCCSW